MLLLEHFDSGSYMYMYIQIEFFLSFVMMFTLNRPTLNCVISN